MKEQPAFGSEETEGGKSVSVGDNVTFIPENVTSGTHSIAQNSTSEHSVAQQSKEQPHFNSPLETGRGEGGGEEDWEGGDFFRIPAGGMFPVRGNGKSGRRRLSMPFFRRLTGHRVTMRGCSIISVATVSRLQNSMRLSLKVISGYRRCDLAWDCHVAWQWRQDKTSRTLSFKCCKQEGRSCCFLIFGHLCRLRI